MDKCRHFSFCIILIVLTACVNNNIQPKDLQDSKKEQEKVLPETNTISLKDKKLFFKLVDYGYAKLGEISGTLTYNNETDYSFSNIAIKEATLEVDFADNTSKDYDIVVIDKSKKWNSKSLHTFSFASNPLDEAPRENNFSRTPEKVVLKFLTNNISIDKEIPLQDEIDLLPEWKAFQAKLGLR